MKRYNYFVAYGCHASVKKSSTLAECLGFVAYCLRGGTPINKVWRAAR